MLLVKVEYDVAKQDLALRNPEAIYSTITSLSREIVTQSTAMYSSSAICNARSSHCRNAPRILSPVINDTLAFTLFPLQRHGKIEIGNTNYSLELGVIDDIGVVGIGRIPLAGLKHAGVGN